MRRIKNSKLKIQNFGRLFLLGLITAIFSLFRPRATSADMKKMEFSASSQRLGVSFTEKVRNIFRGRWIKKA
jgi:hypothetical protein